MGAVRTLFAVLALLVAIPWGFLCGTFGVLPFVVVPRGRRERFTMVAARVWAWVVVHLLLLARPEVRGSPPPSGRGVLYISNHRSWLDPLLLIAHGRAQGLSKMQIFWIPIIGFYGWLSGAVFFNRKSREQRARARQEVLELVRGGHRIFVFPEGTRTRDGELRSKVFLTIPKDCFEAGVEVLPCAVYGTEATLPPGSPQARPFQPSVIWFGEPLRPADYPDADAFALASWAEVERMVDELRREAGELGEAV